MDGALALCFSSMRVCHIASGGGGMHSPSASGHGQSGTESSAVTALSTSTCLHPNAPLDDVGSSCDCNIACALRAGVMSRPHQTIHDRLIESRVSPSICPPASPIQAYTQVKCVLLLDWMIAVESRVSLSICPPASLIQAYTQVKCVLLP